MQGSTVVINPPDGDMRAYLASLQKLIDEETSDHRAGHGYLIGAPQKELARLIAHRRAREEKVVNALVKIGPASVEELLPLVYDDVRCASPRRCPLAHCAPGQADRRRCRPRVRRALCLVKSRTAG